MITINELQCQAVANRCAGKHPARRVLFVPNSIDEMMREANYWIFVIAICQHTKSLQGRIDGTWCRGWDYWCEPLAASQTRWDRPMPWLPWTPPACAPFSRTTSTQTIVRRSIEERLAQLHGVAEALLSDYEGQAMNIYCHAGGHLRGAGGIFERLGKIPHFADPLEKKAQLLVAQLDAEGVWPLEDPENLKVCMDYHAIRVALRTGIVEVTDPGLLIALKQKARVSDEINHLVRRVVSDACDRLVALSGVSVFEFDKWIWHLGRSCCFYDHEPICGPRFCHKMDICTYIKAVDYACPGKCSLDGACKGSRDDFYKAFWETNVYTEYY